MDRSSFSSRGASPQGRSLGRPLDALDRRDGWPDNGVVMVGGYGLDESASLEGHRISYNATTGNPGDTAIIPKGFLGAGEVVTLNAHKRWINARGVDRGGFQGTLGNVSAGATADTAKADQDRAVKARAKAEKDAATAAAKAQATADMRRAGAEHNRAVGGGESTTPPPPASVTEKIKALWAEHPAAVVVVALVAGYAAWRLKRGS